MFLLGEIMGKGGASNEGESVRKSEERVYEIKKYNVGKLLDNLEDYFEKEDNHNRT